MLTKKSYFIPATEKNYRAIGKIVRRLNIVVTYRIVEMNFMEVEFTLLERDITLLEGAMATMV